LQEVDALGLAGYDRLKVTKALKKIKVKSHDTDF